MVNPGAGVPDRPSHRYEPDGDPWPQNQLTWQVPNVGMRPLRLGEPETHAEAESRPPTGART